MSVAPWRGSDRIDRGGPNKKPSPKPFGRRAPCYALDLLTDPPGASLVEWND